MPPELEGLVHELRTERERLFDALGRIEPASLTAPGLIGDWSARELVAHLGYWTGHATEVIHAVESGRVDEVGEGEPPVDEVNATVARVARETKLDAVRRREAASFDALLERLRALDPALLAVRLPDGATLEQGVREDGSDHYREHAEELLRILGATPNG